MIVSGLFNSPTYGTSVHITAQNGGGGLFSSLRIYIVKTIKFPQNNKNTKYTCIDKVMSNFKEPWIKSHSHVITVIFVVARSSEEHSATEC